MWATLAFWLLIHSTVESLGGFKFDKQISSVVRCSFFQLRPIAKVKAYLPQKYLERVIHAFITSRPDYCNSLYVVLDLQLVQNAAARLPTRMKKDTISHLCCAPSTD